MTTSGSYEYAPSIGEMVLYSFNLCGLRSTALTAEHLNSARQAMNMLLVSWANRGVNLWKIDKVEIELEEGVSTYPVEPRTVMILDMYAAMPRPTGGSMDRIMQPISRTEYASYPNKNQEGFPTVFWFDRLINPTVTIWPVPGGSGGPNKIYYYRVTQIETAQLPGGETLDVPYRWLDAFSTGLGYYLARIWTPERKADMKADAEEAYMIAAAQDVENVQFYISPQVSGYYR